MKRLIYIFVALLLVATSCKKDTPVAVNNAAKLIGEWHCTAEDITAEVDVYVEFTADGGLYLYQMVGEGRHRHYTGSWTMSGNILSGSYADGSEWGSSYAVEFSGDDAVKFTAQNGSDEVMFYAREAIPQNIKDGSVEVRSVVEQAVCPIF